MLELLKNALLKRRTINLKIYLTIDLIMPEIEFGETPKKEESMESIEKRIDNLIEKIGSKDAESWPATRPAREIKEEITKNGSKFAMKEFEKVLERLVELNASGDSMNEFFIFVKDGIDKTREMGKVNDYFMKKLNESMQKLKSESDITDVNKRLYSEDPLKELEAFTKE